MLPANPQHTHSQGDIITKAQKSEVSVVSEGDLLNLPSSQTTGSSASVNQIRAPVHTRNTVSNINTVLSHKRISPSQSTLLRQMIELIPCIESCLEDPQKILGSGEDPRLHHIRSYVKGLLPNQIRAFFAGISLGNDFQEFERGKVNKFTRSVENCIQQQTTMPTRSKVLDDFFNGRGYFGDSESLARKAITQQIYLRAIELKGRSESYSTYETTKCGEIGVALRLIIYCQTSHRSDISSPQVSDLMYLLGESDQAKESLRNLYQPLDRMWQHYCKL